MLYKKPANLKYTDLAIWIDEHGSEDTEILFKYLYVLVYMLASKNKYFETEEDCDDFSIYVAERMYFRYQNVGKTMRNHRVVSEVTSVLNYLKKTLPFAYNDFLHDTKPLKPSDTELYSKLEEQSFTTKIDSLLSLKTVPEYITLAIEHIPYKGTQKNSIMLSCYLTLNNYLSRKIKYMENGRLLKPTINNSVILYNVPLELTNYVALVSNRVYKEMYINLSISMALELPSEKVLNSMIYDIGDLTRDYE